MVPPGVNPALPGSRDSVAIVALNGSWGKAKRLEPWERSASTYEEPLGTPLRSTESWVITSAPLSRTRDEHGQCVLTRVGAIGERTCF